MLGRNSQIKPNGFLILVVLRSDKCPLEQYQASPNRKFVVGESLGSSDQNGGESNYTCACECLTSSSLLVAIALGPERLYKGKNLPPRTSECRFLSDFLSALSIIWSSDL